MQKLFVSVAMLGVLASPAMAQAPANPTTQTAPVEKPKTVKKVVCKEVDEERGIGSRLAPTTKVCRTIEVPAPQAKQAPIPQTSNSAR